jgi:CBS-domain-containing membrane protein
MFNGRSLTAILFGAAGGAIAIAIMEWLSVRTTVPLAAIPFATSIVLVMGSPEAKPAQPRALVGGHLISALVGLVVLAVAGPQLWAAALAVGLAIVAMHLAGAFHPPAGINPLIIVTSQMSWSFLLVPVAAGALLLLAFAWIWNNYVVRGQRWPERWW